MDIPSVWEESSIDMNEKIESSDEEIDFLSIQEEVKFTKIKRILSENDIEKSGRGGKITKKRNNQERIYSKISDSCIGIRDRLTQKSLLMRQKYWNKSENSLYLFSSAGDKKYVRNYFHHVLYFYKKNQRSKENVYILHEFNLIIKIDNYHKQIELDDILEIRIKYTDKNGIRSYLMIDLDTLSVLSFNHIPDSKNNTFNSVFEIKIPDQTYRDVDTRSKRIDRIAIKDVLFNKKKKIRIVLKRANNLVEKHIAPIYMVSLRFFNSDIFSKYTNEEDCLEKISKIINDDLKTNSYLIYGKDERKESSNKIIYLPDKHITDMSPENHILSTSLHKDNTDLIDQSNLYTGEIVEIYNGKVPESDKVLESDKNPEFDKVLESDIVPESDKVLDSVKDSLLIDLDKHTIREDYKVQFHGNNMSNSRVLSMSLDYIPPDKFYNYLSNYIINNYDRYILFHRRKNECRNLSEIDFLLLPNYFSSNWNLLLFSLNKISVYSGENLMREVNKLFGSPLNDSLIYDVIGSRFFCGFVLDIKYYMDKVLEYQDLRGRTFFVISKINSYYILCCIEQIFEHTLATIYHIDGNGVIRYSPRGTIIIGKDRYYIPTFLLNYHIADSTNESFDEKINRWNSKI